MNHSLVLWHNKNISWLSINDFLPEENQLIIKSTYSMISLGTERLLTSSQLTNETATNMIVPHMKGHFHAAFTYGYSLVGKVDAGPSEFTGKMVHLMHPHQDLVAANMEDVSILPDHLDPKTATLASNMETAVNAIWDGDAHLGDRVMVIGYGIIGALIALLAKKATGEDVTILDKNTDKQKAFTRDGHLKFETEAKADYDVIFNTSGSAEMLQSAIHLTRTEGKIVEVSWYGDQKIEINLGGHFHYGRKQIICSQVSQIPHKKQPNWDFKKRKKLVFKLLEELNPLHLIEQEVPYSETPTFYEQLRKGTINSLGVIIKY